MEPSSSEVKGRWSRGGDWAGLSKGAFSVPEGRIPLGVKTLSGPHPESD